MATNNIKYVSEETLDNTIEELSKVLSAGTKIDFPITVEQGGSSATTAEKAWENFGGGDVGKLNTNKNAETFLNGMGQWVKPKGEEYSVFNQTTDGLVPHPDGTTSTKFLREDGNWVIPTDTNTDTKVTQTNNTSASSYPVLVKNGTGTGTITDTVIFNDKVTVTPSTGTLAASVFQGNLKGNAETADSAAKADSAETANKLSSAEVGDTSKPVYFSNGVPTECSNIGTVYIGSDQPSDPNVSLWIIP